MTVRLALPLVPLVPFLALVACAGEEASGPVSTVRDSAGVRIVESAAPAWAEAEEEGWTLAGTPGLVIGVVDGAPEAQLFRVTAARRLDDGGVALVNAGTGEVRRYDASGGYVWGVGGVGDGPGEFRQPNALELLPGDSIGVFDVVPVRLTVLDLDGKLGRVLSLPRAGASGQHNPLGFTGEGALYVQLGWSSAQDDPATLQTGRRRIHDLLAYYRLGEAAVDTVGTFPGSEQMTVVAGSARSFGSAPFGWSRVQAVRGSELLLAYTERFAVHVHSPTGELRSVFRAAVPPDAVTQAEIDEYLATTRANLRDNPSENPLIRELGELRLAATTFPPTHPVLDRLIADRLGYAWVRHARRAGAEGPFTWSVFDPEGQWLGRLQMPELLRPLDIGPDFVLGVVTDELGVEYVHVYALDRR